MITILTPQANVKGDGPLRVLALDAKAMHATGSYTATHVSYDIEPQFIAVSEALGIIQVPGTTIEQMPLFIKVDSPDELVPADLFGASNEDGDAVTWAEWCMTNKPVIERAGQFFVRTSSHTNNWPELTTLEPVYAYLVKSDEIPSAASETV
jgi:hypothetical protein